MAGARQFDLDVAADAAAELFWRQGYTATSVRELCDAMGVRPGSFYAAFGSKQGCFRVALDRYLAAQFAGVTRRPGPEAIRAWLRAIVAPSRRHRGCLLVNTAAEGPSLDAPTRRFVAERLRAMDEFFVRCLGTRARAGEHAAIVSSAVVAVHVLARAGAPAPRLRATADAALRAVGIAGLDDS